MLRHGIISSASDPFDAAAEIIGPEEEGVATAAVFVNDVARRYLAYPIPAEKEWEPEDVYTHTEEMVLCWSARVAGLISLLSGLYMFVVAWRHRSRNVFHRLMLALSAHILLWSPWQIYGTAAVPAGTPDHYGTYGTTTTCTAQGFVNQFCGMSIALYYAGLSVYSWAVIVHGNFDPTKYSFIEDYIHAVVHMFPIGSAIFLLSIQAYNSNGLTCYIASVPFGCGDDSGIECTRGPQNISAVLWAAAGVPALFVVLFPTIVMVALTVTVCRIYAANANAMHSHQLLFGMTPGKVCRQSVVYLGVIYLIYFPQYAYKIITVMLNKKSFGAAVATSVVSTSRGLWIALVYWYFSFYGSSGVFGRFWQCIQPQDEDKLQRITERNTKRNSKAQNAKRREKKRNAKHNAKRSKTTVTPDLEHSEAEEDCSATSVITPVDHITPIDVRGGKQRQEDGLSPLGNNNKKTNSKKSVRIANSKRYSFNIFDGTDVAGDSSGPFSDFVFDGDEEDAAIDESESQFWSGCQNVNSERSERKISFEDPAFVS